MAYLGCVSSRPQLIYGLDGDLENLRQFCVGVLCETQRNCETPAELCPDFSETRINVNQKPQPKYCQIMGNVPKWRVFLNIFPCFVAYGMGIGILSNKQRNTETVFCELCT